MGSLYDAAARSRVQSPPATPPWRGPVNPFDPGRGRRLLVHGTPDWAVYPYHRPGTWERALVFMSAGYHPEPEDLAALEAWSRRPELERSAYLRKARATRSAVTQAAFQALERGEVLGADQLSRRIAGQPGVPHNNAAREVLKTVLPWSPEDGVVPSSVVHKMYMADGGGRPGHYFARRADTLLEFRAARKAWQREKGRATALDLDHTSRPRDWHGRYLPRTNETERTSA